MKRVILRAVLCLMVCVLCFTGCANQEEGFADERFINSQMDLYVEMFQASDLKNKGKTFLYPRCLFRWLWRLPPTVRRGRQGRKWKLFWAGIWPLRS